MHISFKNKTVSLDTPKIMGILNVTPDSFSDGGSFNKLDCALAHAEQMVKDGASIIDIGGESTRPGAASVSLDEELSRVIPAVEAISKNLDVMISVDTSQPQVMKEAVSCGAHIWNDIRALRLEGALEMASSLQVPVILMHMQGDPVTMQVNPHYDDVVAEVEAFLSERTAQAVKAGIKKENIILDLGFGFGKSPKHNYQLLDAMDKFVASDFPVLSALSRKSMIGAATGIEDPKQRVTGSVAGALISIQKGAQLVRVHDVAQTRQAFDVYLAMLDSRI